MIQYSFAGVEIPCPLCKSDDHSIVGTLDRHGEPLRTVMCRACGHVFTNPQPTKSELQEFYSKKYRLAYKGTGTPKQNMCIEPGNVRRRDWNSSKVISIKGPAFSMSDPAEASSCIS